MSERARSPANEIKKLGSGLAVPSFCLWLKKVSSTPRRQQTAWRRDQFLFHPHADHLSVRQTNPLARTRRLVLRQFCALEINDRGFNG